MQTITVNFNAKLYITLDVEGGATVNVEAAASAAAPAVQPTSGTIMTAEEMEQLADAMEAELQTAILQWRDGADGEREAADPDDDHDGADVEATPAGPDHDDHEREAIRLEDMELLRDRTPSPRATRSYAANATSSWEAPPVRTPPRLAHPQTPPPPPYPPPNLYDGPLPQGKPPLLQPPARHAQP